MSPKGIWKDTFYLLSLISNLWDNNLILCRYPFPNIVLPMVLASIGDSCPSASSIWFEVVSFYSQLIVIRQSKSLFSYFTFILQFIFSQHFADIVHCSLASILAERSLLSHIPGEPTAQQDHGSRSSGPAQFPTPSLPWELQLTPGAKSSWKAQLATIYLRKLDSLLLMVLTLVSGTTISIKTHTLQNTSEQWDTDWIQGARKPNRKIIVKPLVLLYCS